MLNNKRKCVIHEIIGNKDLPHSNERTYKRHHISPNISHFLFFSYLVNYLCKLEKHSIPYKGSLFCGDGNLAKHLLNVFLAFKGHLLA